MSRELERKLRTIVRVANSVEGFLDQCYQQAATVERIRAKGHALYERSHWGSRGRASDSIGTAADVASGVVELGALYRIDYLTRKGVRGTVDEYYHHFETPLPLLCYAADGSGLVIVRGRSRYTVTAHGIEG